MNRVMSAGGIQSFEANSESKLLSERPSLGKISYTISARVKFITHMPIMDFLRINFPQVALESVDSIFGFVERSTLYGGRPFQTRELTENDVTAMYAHGIGLRLPISNSYVSREEYEEAKPFLNKYHRQGNSVIVTNDDLARWIRVDFSLYHIEASAIKNIDSMKKLTKALAMYDTVVLPAKSNDDIEFLSTIEQKERIRLFLNAGCAYNCPSKICYPSVSKMNKYQGDEYKCSQPLIPREVMMHHFDEKMFVDMGFSKFKLLRTAKLTAY